MNRSPERHTFQMNSYIERCREDGKEPREDYLDLYRTEIEEDRKHEADDEWKKDNLEYDLRSTKWICDKAREREDYAQHIYAALCNQDWQKNDVWHILGNQTWGCSWRYAGGIVADMIESGDYIDWYCSGIQGGASENELAAMTEEQRTKYQWYQKHFVGEGHITDEIREDFFKLGWMPAPEKEYE